ncbi:MAG: hypothetical protein NTV30_08195 [Chloroflexi bacterium]|nr:hypothetical protein [Chloroflexota bacterium]
MDKKPDPSDDRTLKELTPNIAALLCYVGGWISGIVFLVLEKKNLFIRFHAMQSIIVFSILTVAGVSLGNIPYVGIVFACLITATSLILWLVLMLTAYAGEKLKIPWAGNLAERLSIESTEQINQEQPHKQDSVPVVPVNATEKNNIQPSRQIRFKDKYYSIRAWRGRIIGSSFAILWSIVLLIFFNFFYRYIAYYDHVTEGGIERWQMTTLVTSNIHDWLPVLTTVLVITIIAHIVLIAFDRYLLRQLIELVLNVLSIVVVATLLSIFPFDFDVLPGADVSRWIQLGVTVTLILAIVGISIDIIVRLVKLIVNTIEGKY